MVLTVWDKLFVGFGRVWSCVSDRAAEIITPGGPYPVASSSSVDAAINRFDTMRHAEGFSNVAELRLKCKKNMQKHCAVFRTRELLQAGVENGTQVASDLKDVVFKDRSLIWNTDLVEALELDNLVKSNISNSALCTEPHRKSWGSCRDDYKNRDDENWMKHTYAWLENTEVRLDYRDVVMSTLSSERLVQFHQKSECTKMAEFTLPKNSKVEKVKPIRRMLLIKSLSNLSLQPRYG